MINLRDKLPKEVRKGVNSWLLASFVSLPGSSNVSTTIHPETNCVYTPLCGYSNMLRRCDSIINRPTLPSQKSDLQNPSQKSNLDNQADKNVSPNSKNLADYIFKISQTDNVEVIKDCLIQIQKLVNEGQKLNNAVLAQDKFQTLRKNPEADDPVSVYFARMLMEILKEVEPKRVANIIDVLLLSLDVSTADDKQVRDFQKAFQRALEGLHVNFLNIMRGCLACLCFFEGTPTQVTRLLGIENREMWWCLQSTQAPYELRDKF